MAAQKGIGRLVQFGVAKETTRGTAIASAAYWNPWNDLIIDEKKEFAVDAQSYGIIEDSVNLTQTKQWAQGSISGNILDQSFGLILYSTFGTLTSHSAHSGESIVHQSLTFFLHDPLAAVDYSYANGVVEKLEINMALKKFMISLPPSKHSRAHLKALSLLRPPPKIVLSRNISRQSWH